MLNADQNLPAEVDWHREPATDYAAPWEAFLNYVEEIERVHWITQSALRNINGLGRLSEILHRSKGAEGEALIAEAVQLEDAINGEVGRGTPLLLAHSAVAVWAALETTIPSFVAHWLFENPETLQEKPFEKIKLPVSQAVGLSGIELMFAVVEAVDQVTGGSQKLGIGRFEAILDACGLSGGLSDDYRRDLFELSQVRNLVVHRFSVADERFVKSCPWFGLSVGERLILPEARLHAYIVAARNYGACILERACELSG